MSWYERQEAARKKKQKIIIGGVAAVVLGVSGLLWAIFDTTEYVTEVQLHEWQRNIDIEDYQPRRYTREWSHPADAYEIYEYEEDASYTDDDGNYVSDSDTYYDYTVDRWAYSKTLSKCGNNKEPQWPSTLGLRVQNTVEPQYGQERERGRQTHLFLHLFHKESNKTYRAEVEKEQWDRIEYGQIVTAHVNHFGTVRRVTDKQ